MGPVFPSCHIPDKPGHSKEDILDKGVQSLINYMGLASAIGAAGVIVHPGSHGGAGYKAIFPRYVSSIQRVLDHSPEGPCLVLENMAGMGQHIGAKFEDLAGFWKRCKTKAKVCLDTQHCFAAGYDMTNKQGIEAMIAEFDQDVGVSNLLAVHANDSKRPCGSGVDRHDNIGDGFIGEDGFAAIMGNPAFQDVPFLLEVPGFQGKGPDRQNIDILKKIRQEAASAH